MEGIYGASTLVIPPAWLAWLAESDVRFALWGLQRWHGELRLLHLLGTAALFGAILLLDLRLLGLAARELPLDRLSRLVLPAAHGGFALAVGTGVVLFLFDPIQTGSHSWFLPKLLLLAAAVANAGVFSLPRGWGLRAIGGGSLTRHARAAGLVSLALWTGVIVCATANHEERPALRKLR